MSLSARRAWIEKYSKDCTYNQFHVALRKESVDRKTIEHPDNAMQIASLSARRAWIEKTQSVKGFGSLPSLSARRAWIENPVPKH